MIPKYDWYWQRWNDAEDKAYNHPDYYVGCGEVIRSITKRLDVIILKAIIVEEDKLL